MQRLVILLLLNIFLITATAVDDGCCNEETGSVSAYSQSIEQHQESHDAGSPVNCDCSQHLNCVHGGGISITEAGNYDLNFARQSAVEFGHYISSTPPSPLIDGPFQPPKA